MTTRQFIERQFRNADGKERVCSSVFKDGYGNIYSYGYHYPLLFNINGKTFINTAGYSITTAKHINWAWSAVNYQAIAVELPGDFRLPDWTTDNFKLVLSRLERILVEKIVELEMEAAKKTRHNTQVFENLQYQISKNKQALEAVRA